LVQLQNLEAILRTHAPRTVMFGLGPSIHEFKPLLETL
jgi:hypothetical protein